MFEDEGRFGRISDRRSCWAPLPMRPDVGHQVIREYVYAYGAVSPSDGGNASLVLPWSDTQTMSIFLKHTAEIFSSDYCIMFMDGAGWHRAGHLKVPENMHRAYLPPYSPELNPVEHIGDYVRENYFGNEVFSSLKKVVDRLSLGLKNLHNQPEIIKSMTSFNWINTLCLTSN